MTLTAGSLIHISARWPPNGSGQKTILRCGRASPARPYCCTQTRAFSAAPKRRDWQAISDGAAPKPYPAQDTGFSMTSRTRFFPLSKNFSDLVPKAISGAQSELSFGSKISALRRSRSLDGGRACKIRVYPIWNLIRDPQEPCQVTLLRRICISCIQSATALWDCSRGTAPPVSSNLVVLRTQDVQTSLDINWL